MPGSSTIHLTSPRGWLLAFAVAGLAFLAATLVPVHPTVAQGRPAVDIQAATDGITVDFFATTPRNVLTFSVRVVGPERFVFEQRVEDVSLQWIPPQNLADGIYNWEAWVVSADVGAQMRDLTPALQARSNDHWFDEEVKQTHIASGNFKVANGLMENMGQSDEGGLILGTRRVANAIFEFLVPSATAQEASFANDAFAIMNAGSGASMLQLWESGATEAWRILNLAGEANRFEIRYQNVPQMVILSEIGHVGIGTTTPNAMLEIGGDTPRIQMNLEGAEWHFGAFSDPAFGIQNLAAPSVPFGIFGDAPTASLFLTGSGAGFGTTAPAAAVHVQRADNTAEVRVQDTGAFDGQTMFNLINNGHPKFRMEDTSQASVVWEFRTAGIQGGNESFNINKVGSGAAEMRVFAGGNVTIAGILTQSSSRAVKERITELDPEEVLARLEELSVHEWSYQNNPGERHLGPMAEDFHAAFGLGGSDKHIAPGDLAGVALAAAKALHEQVEVKDRRITELESKSAALESETAALGSENAELRERLDRLEAMLQSSM